MHLVHLVLLQATQGSLAPGMQQQPHLLQLLAASRVQLRTGMHTSSTTSSSSKARRQVQLLLGSSRHMQVPREPHQQQQQRQQVVLPVSRIKRLT
jgi:hypothetical protein